MDYHKEKCKKLKKIRKQMADMMGIDLHQTQCTYEGPCQGTCPKCKHEEDILNRAILGKGMAVAGAGMMSVSLAGCSPLVTVERTVERVIDRFDTNQISGDVTDYVPSEDDYAGGLESIYYDEGENNCNNGSNDNSSCEATDSPDSQDYNTLAGDIAYEDPTIDITNEVSSYLEIDMSDIASDASQDYGELSGYRINIAAEYEEELFKRLNDRYQNSEDVASFTPEHEYISESFSKEIERNGNIIAIYKDLHDTSQGKDYWGDVYVLRSNDGSLNLYYLLFKSIETVED